MPANREQPNTDPKPEPTTTGAQQSATVSVTGSLVPQTSASGPPNEAAFMQNHEPNSEATAAEPNQEAPTAEPASKRAATATRTAKDVKVGDTVFYHQNPKSNAKTWRWVEAEVIDSEPRDGATPLKLATPLSGTVHLRVHFDREIDFSSGEYGIRLNVPHGRDMGEWDFEAPEGWERAYEREIDRNAQRVQIRREEMARN